MTPHTVSSVPRRAARLLEVEQACSSLACYFLSSVVCCALVCSLGTLECWGGRQGGCGLELCVRLLRVCGSPLTVCLVSLFVSVCRSCVPSSICPASTHTALVSSPSLAVLHLPTYIHTLFGPRWYHTIPRKKLEPCAAAPKKITRVFCYRYAQGLGWATASTTLLSLKSLCGGGVPSSPCPPLPPLGCLFFLSLSFRFPRRHRCYYRSTSARSALQAVQGSTI